MNRTNRNELIHLLSNELYSTVSTYIEAAGEKGFAIPGCEVSNFESKNAIQRRIMVLREELLELSKSL